MSDDSIALEHSARLAALLHQRIQAQDGIPFSDFMQAALYEPGLGYYSAGARKLGRGGDFTTAPEISPLFSRCLARQCAELLAVLGGDAELMEFGAGSGAMAVEILGELARMDCLPRRYTIIEVSADLRQRQREAIQSREPTLLSRVHWADAPPRAGFVGVVLANELLDALPVHRFGLHEGRVMESIVRLRNGALVESFEMPRTAELVPAVRELGPLPEGYVSEIGLYARGWVRELASFLERGRSCWWITVIPVRPIIITSEVREP